MEETPNSIGFLLRLVLVVTYYSFELELAETLPQPNDDCKQSLFFGDAEGDGGQLHGVVQGLLEIVLQLCDLLLEDDSHGLQEDLIEVGRIEVAAGQGRVFLVKGQTPRLETGASFGGDVGEDFILSPFSHGRTQFLKHVNGYLILSL